MRKFAQGLSFESYVNRILSLKNHEKLTKKNPKRKVKKRNQVKNSMMNTTSIKIWQFARLNDQHYYFSDGVASL